MKEADSGDVKGQDEPDHEDHTKEDNEAVDHHEIATDALIE